MNEISCDTCMDLIPLVRDGIASGDSRDAVMAHIGQCGECRAFFDGETPQTDADEAFAKFRKKTSMAANAVMILGMVLGIGLTNGTGLLYNAIIMPLIGAVGYYIYSSKAFYSVPVLLALTYSAVRLADFVGGGAVFGEEAYFIWLVIYCVFALVGVTIASLLHFAFHKED